MKVHHHVSDEWLLDYAAGNLSEGWSLAVATHLALCPACRRQLGAIEGAAGALLDKISVEPAADDDSWQRMRSRLSTITLPLPQDKSEPRREYGRVPVIPEPLRSYLGSDVDGLKWQALGRGAYHIRIPTEDPSTQVRLLRIPAGKPVPEHTHSGRELTLVLSGSFRDGETLFARGDIEEADDDLLHTPTASEGEDCICLAVTEAPLRFSSWIVRMIQPILKI